MELLLMEEDTRPRLYYFVKKDDVAAEVGKVFFMGDIKKKIEEAEAFGCTVANKDDFL